MLVQSIEAEGEVSKRPSESQPIPSPTYPSEDQPESQPDPSPKPSSSIPIPDSNPEGSGGNHGAQAAAIKDLKAQIKQLKKKAIPVINHHKAWFRAARLKKQQKKKDMEKSKKRRSVSKQGRKAIKSSKDKGKTDSKVEEPKTSSKIKELHLSDESTVKPDESTIKQDEGTDRQVEGTAENKDQDSRESATLTAPTTTSTPTPTVFSDDETIAQVLFIMSQNKVKQKEKEKVVELKNVEDIKRPRPTSTRSVLTLKPLHKINPKAKGKGMIEEEDESDTESEDITEAEEKKERLAEEEATKAAFTNEYDFIQARLNADKILIEKVQEEERENFTIEERAKLLHDTIAAQRRFLAQQRSEDERLIKDLNKKAAGIKKADSIKEESKEEEGTKKRKLGTRKKMKSRKRRFRQDTSEDDETNSEKENDELRLCLTIAPDEDKEYDETKDLEEINLNVVIRSNGQRRYFSTLMSVLSIFDRDDLCVVYQLVMDKYQDEIPEDFDIVLWGDLMIMFNPSDEDEFWNSQQDWNVVSWKLHGSSGVHTLMTEAGLVIHMLVEKKYPLRKKVLLQMLELKLESEEDNTMALELIRFVKKLITKLEPENSNGDEEDL
ncbi:hypothetical protein Tco_1131741 [Tanacetum coccineum]|uniref:Uncharacterized protein n=1 Tax=Tanacetum coccineum TaxID=301880 RepID=A0ABQ5J9X6_9ASTR